MGKAPVVNMATYSALDVHLPAESVFGYRETDGEGFDEVWAVRIHTPTGEYKFRFDGTVVTPDES